MIKWLLCLICFSFLTACGYSLLADEDKSNKEATKEGQVFSLNVTYVGLMDPHTIEVLINGEPTAIQINDEQFKILEKVPTNEQIKISFNSTNGTNQNFLQAIELSH